MNEQIERALRLCPNLPSLSGVALQIVEMGRDPEVDVGALAATLSNDPALTSKILRIANSPLYSQRRRSKNLRQAVMLLGLNATVTLALSFSLADSLRMGDGATQGLERVWQRALLAATAARLLGSAQGLQTLEELFLAGLLQDIGIMALNAALPRQYPALLARAGCHDELVELECETLGADHAEAGAWLMEHWGLPEYLPLAARCSHDPEQADAAGTLAGFMGVVGVSGVLADVCLGAEDERLWERAAATARERLGLEADRVHAVVSSLAETAPELEALFDLRILEPAQAGAIVDQARELLAARNLQLLQEVAEQRREAEEYKRLHRELEEKASRDALTGLYNRGYLDVCLGEEFDHAKLQGWPLTVGFLDLDHFKVINDNYGHQAGDALLVEVAKVLRAQVRGGDFVVRYGGEEFVVLLPGTPLEDGHGVFERIRRALGHHAFALDDDCKISITASVGVAGLMDERHDYDGPDELLRAADRALYMAKHMGRDRVELAD